MHKGWSALSMAILLVAVAMAGCLRETESPNLTEKTVLLVVSQKDFRDSEFTDTRDYLSSTGATVEVASTDASQATGVDGLRLTPDVGLQQADPSRYDAVVFIGGPGSKTYLWPNEYAQGLAKESFNSGRIVAAICLSPVVLARAGILSGVAVTGFNDPDLKREMEKAGAQYRTATVVRDGRIITGSGPTAAKEFARTIAEALSK